MDDLSDVFGSTIGSSVNITDECLFNCAPGAPIGPGFALFGLTVVKDILLFFIGKIV